MPLMVAVWACALICLSSAFGGAAIAGPGRVALLIGNSEYNGIPGIQRQGDPLEGHLNDLPNACSDVEAVAAELELRGWDMDLEVQLECDATASQIRNALVAFTERYMDMADGGFGFIYYAGHAVQVDGQAFIFGADAVVDVEKSIDNYEQYPDGNIFARSVRIKEGILGEIGRPGDSSIFMVLDACRENFISEEMKKRLQPQGLRVSAPTGPMTQYPGFKILYSTAEGEFASDGVGAASPFAEEFIFAMRQPHRLDTLITTVVKRVANKTFEFDKETAQLPQEVGSLQPPPPELCFSNVCNK